MAESRVFLPAPKGFDAEAYARAAAPAIGLSIPEEELAEVAANLARTAGFAALVAEALGVADTEPAPVFRAGEDGA